MLAAKTTTGVCTMKIIKTGLYIFATASLLAQTTLAAPASVLLEKGIYTEEMVGDLSQAIEIYSEIVESEKANREVVAEALFRMGRCLAEAGRVPNALNALNQLVTQYSDQKTLVEKAIALTTRLAPEPLFPTMDGCRLKYDVVIQFKDSPEAVIGRPLAFNQTDTIEWVFDVVPSLEGRIDRFVLTKAPARSKPSAGEPVATTLPGSYRSGEVDVLNTKPGVYDFTVVGYEGEQAVTRSQFQIDIQPAMYAQLGVNDIQPNGDIRFSSAQHSPNVKQKVTTHGFRNSDFVHIEKMVDGDGHEVAFTEKHDGSMYRYHATLNKPVLQGETLFLGTSGWSESLIRKTGANEYRYSMNHTPGTDVPARRVEIFRLPKGAQLLNTNPIDLPHRTLEDGRTEILIDTIIPTGGSLLTEFSYTLEGQNDTAQLTLLPAPWQAGEVLRYRLLTKTGMEMGHLIWTVNGVEHEGRPCWKIEQRLVIPSAGSTMASYVIAEKESFAPVISRTSHQIGTVNATYLPGKVLLQNKGADAPRVVEVPGPIYDNDQGIFMMQRLPLAEGYTATFPIMSVLSGAPGLECRIRVMERKTVESEHIDYWIVRIQVYMGSMKAVEQTAWFRVDDLAPVKVITDQLNMELMEKSIAPAAEMKLKKHAATLTLPDGWFGYELPTEGKGSEIVRLLPPEMKLTGMLCKTVRQSATISVNDIAQTDIDMSKGYFSNYTVRKDSVTEKTINGMPAKLFAADYTDQGLAKVEYRAYYIAGPKVFWFVFRMDPELFNDEQVALDELIHGLNVETPKLGHAVPVSLEFRVSDAQEAPGWKKMDVSLSDESIYVAPEVALSNEDIASARVMMESDEPQIGVEFTLGGAKKFSALTEGNIGKRLAILVDGNVISAPIIMAHITGNQAMITGNFTENEAKRIAEGIVRPSLAKVIQNAINNSESEPHQLRLALRGSDWWIRDRQLSTEELQSIPELMPSTDVTIVLAAPKEATHQQLIEMLNILSNGGVQNVMFATAAEEQK
jgi:biopolymer transport protein ExbD